MSNGKENALNTLSKDLKGFRSKYKQKGWEDAELDEKINDFYVETFPWYKFNGSLKPTKIWQVLRFLIGLFILGLAISAVLSQNLRLKKNLKDKLYDSQLDHQFLRALRKLTLPLHRWFGLVSYFDNDCIVFNPYHVKEPIACDFCADVVEVRPTRYDDPNISDYMTDQELLIIDGAPEYEGIKYSHLQDLFKEHGTILDKGMCKVNISDSSFERISDVLKLSEEEFFNQKLGILWKNCLSQSTRFYRKLFKKPSFLLKSSEIYIEKLVFIVHPNAPTASINLTEIIAKANHGRNVLIAQVTGSSNLRLDLPSDCNDDEKCQPVSTDVSAGQVVSAVSNNWSFSMQATGDDLSIVYVSTWS